MKFDSRSSALDRVFERMLREQRVPAKSRIYSTDDNERFWDEYDWSKQGYEWGSREWVERMLESTLAIALQPGCRVLEIGPGAGRLTELLLRDQREVVIADISRVCLDQTLARFPGAKLRAVQLGVDDVGKAIAPASLDAVVSFDCFVHVDEATTARYLALLRGLLKPGAHGVIHHPDTRHAGGRRSDVHLASFVEMLVTNDFLPLQHLRWVQEHVHLLGHYDYVTLFRSGLARDFLDKVEQAKRDGRDLNGRPL
jgi:SAM-dependent methyltransferase